MAGLVDSHCHINFPELAADLTGVIARMQAAHVTHALCVSVSLETFPEVLRIAERFPSIYASVGVHPNERGGVEPSAAQLAQLATHPKVLAIGETGLDYYRQTGELEWQRKRFRTHVQAARASRKPLIIHCRQAAADTIQVLQEEQAQEVGGVMHCFTETLAVAEQAMKMGFYISFSGIVTFNNAHELREVARKVPLERILIETDSPYLAPEPHRGRTNEPAYVRQVAKHIAELKSTSFESVAEETSKNFRSCFGVGPQAATPERP